MRDLFARLLLLLACAIAPLAAQAQQAAIPRLDTPVVDTTGTLDAAQKQQLEQQAYALQQRKGSQLQVLIVPSTQPETIEAYAVRAFEQWKLGRKGVDDAVLLVVAKDDRKVRIEVGYGLEGAIPDIIAGRVIQEYLVPKFRAGDYGGGIADATAAAGQADRRRALARADGGRSRGQGGDGGDWLFALFAAFIVATIVRGVFGRTPAGVRGVLTGGAAGGVAWLMSALLGLGGVAAVLGFPLRPAQRSEGTLCARWRLGWFRWRRLGRRRWLGWRRRWRRQWWRLVGRRRHERRRRRLRELVMLGRPLMHLFARSAHRLYPAGQPAAHHPGDRRGRVAPSRRNLLRGRIGLADAERGARRGGTRTARSKLFAQLRVWDTHANNGVLVYLLLADHRIEIVADRGLDARVSAEQWRGVCVLMEERLKAGEPEAGRDARASPRSQTCWPNISRASTGEADVNELPDSPRMLD